MDRISAMEAFVAVVETGGFSAGAERTGFSKAVIAKRVRGLEESVGAQLFHRTTRKVQTTRAGDIFYRHSMQILRDYCRANDEITEETGALKGEIRLNAPMSLGARYLMPSISSFLEKYPSVDVDVTLTDHFVDVIGDGYDLVLRIDEMESSSMVARPLTQVKRHVCASPSYLAKRGTPTKPSELASHDVLHYGLQRSGTRWHFRKGDVHEHLDVPVSFTANNGMALAEAARCGMGIALLPKFITSDVIEEGELVGLLPDYSSPSLTLHALWPENRFLSTRIRRLIDHLVDYFSEMSLR